MSVSSRLLQVSQSEVDGFWLEGVFSQSSYLSRIFDFLERVCLWYPNLPRIT